MFYVVNINYPKDNSDSSSLQLLLFGAIACDALLAILLILLLLRRGLNSQETNAETPRFSKLSIRCVFINKNSFSIHN